MKTVVMGGASGLIGQALAAYLEGRGWQVKVLMRPGSDNPSGRESIAWNPSKGELEVEKLEGVQAVVHLGGANIAGERWSPARKKIIRDSRVHSTKLLSEALASLSRKPAVFLCASATGVYGDRGHETLTEASPAGKGFLAEVGLAWEAACETARRAKIRVVNARLSMVLSKEGGALEKMLMPFKLGLGGVMGSGEQYWSWIALQDAVAGLGYCLEESDITGAVNLTSPQPVTNKAFTKTFAKVISRPAFFPVPKWSARLVLGEMADALMFQSSRVIPKALLDHGFSFQYPTLEQAIKYELTKL